MTATESTPIVGVPLSALRPAPWNPRTISDAQFARLCASIEEDPGFLWRRPVLANASGEIYAGRDRFFQSVQIQQ